jgi:hypothetical protein
MDLHMKKISNNEFLIAIPLTLLLSYFCADILFDPKYVVYIKPFIIPTFILYVYKSNKKRLSVNYILFVSFFYVNETLLLYWEDSVPLYKTALIASFFSYLALINLGYSSLKSKTLFTLPKGYSLFILILNCIFLIAVLYIVTTAINDFVLTVIIIINAIVAVFLGATAVIYLGKFGNTQAYLYFFGAFALIFNDIFAAIGSYLIDNIVLNTLDRILHFTAFFIIYFFVTSQKKVDNLTLDYRPL